MCQLHGCVRTRGPLALSSPATGDVTGLAFAERVGGTVTGKGPAEARAGPEKGCRDLDVVLCALWIDASALAITALRRSGQSFGTCFAETLCSKSSPTVQFDIPQRFFAQPIVLCEPSHWQLMGTLKPFLPTSRLLACKSIRSQTGSSSRSKLTHSLRRYPLSTAGRIGPLETLLDQAVVVCDVVPGIIDSHNTTPVLRRDKRRSRTSCDRAGLDVTMGSGPANAVRVRGGKG